MFMFYYQCLVLLYLTFYPSAHSFEQSDEGLYNFPQLGEFKFIVHISSKAGFCTGSVVTADWILTAAHCLYFRKKVIGKRDARIMAGVVDYQNPDPYKKQETMSIEIRVHPNFIEHSASKYDVALVKLRDSLEFGPYVDKIRVAGDEWPQNENESQNCITLGYGSFRSNYPDKHFLKAWNVTAAHGSDKCPCTMSWQWKRLVCVIEKKYPLTCKGDDGGPLVCGNYVRAITHMSWDRMDCDDEEYPENKCIGGPAKGVSMYMFLCPANDWMHSVVTDIPQRPPSCSANPLSCSLVLSLMCLTLILFLY